MKTALFSFHKFEEPYFEKSNLDKDKFHLYRLSLSLETVQLSAGFEAVSLFVNDDASAPVLEILHTTESVSLPCVLQDTIMWIW